MIETKIEGGLIQGSFEYTDNILDLNYYIPRAYT